MARVKRAVVTSERPSSSKSSPAATAPGTGSYHPDPAGSNPNWTNVAPPSPPQVVRLTVVTPIEGSENEPEAFMPHVYLPSDHTDADLILAADIAAAVSSSDLYVT